MKRFVAIFSCGNDAGRRRSAGCASRRIHAPESAATGRSSRAKIPRPRPSPLASDKAWVEDADRRLHPGRTQESRTETRAGRRPRHADPPRHLRPHRSAADARRDRRLRRRQIAERLGEGGRPPAGLAALRRTVGPPLARRGPLRREPTATSTTCTVPTPGAIAITWCRASTTTSPTTNSSRSNWPATRWTPRTRHYLVASGFNRLGPLRKNAGNQDVASSHNEVLTEMTNIVGAAFLGVTVGCARCHDHKFDPFRQSDYYRLQAHFAQTQPNDLVLASQGGAGRLEGQGRARAAGEAPPADAIAPRARRREGQARNCSSTRWTTRCRRRSPPSTA